LSLDNNNNFNHVTSGVMSGTTTSVSKGPTSNVTTASVVIPKITVNKYGHVTSLEEYTFTPTFPDDNYYPTNFSWTDGTTFGPTGSLTGNGMSSVTFEAIPSASASVSGIVTTSA
jgi:hypothetical protein